MCTGGSTPAGVLSHDDDKIIESYPQIRFVFHFTAQTAVKRRAFVRVSSASTAAKRRELEFLSSLQVICYVVVLARGGYSWSPVAFCIFRGDASEEGKDPKEAAPGIQPA